MTGDARTWRAIRARLRADRRRLLDVLQRRGEPCPRVLLLYPPWLAVLLYRLAHLCHLRRRWLLARLLWQLDTLLTGADISPACDIGPGLVIPNPLGVSMSGNAGRNLTIEALAGSGGLLPDHEDVGAGPGLPVIGDDVCLGPRSGALGPVRIGNGARLGAGCLVTRDVPSGAAVRAAPPVGRGPRSRR